MQTKQGQSLPLLKLNDENYLVPKGEEHLYHVRIEVKKFSPETGDRMSFPRIQKFGAKGYTTYIARNLKKQGFTLDVLHNPAEWLKGQAEMKQQSIANQLAAKQQIQEQKQADSEAAIQKRVDEAVEKALKGMAKAEMKAVKNEAKAETSPEKGK